MHLAVVICVPMAICCAVPAQTHTLVDSGSGVIAKPSSEREKRGVAYILASFLKTAYFRAKHGRIFYYWKPGGYTQARADFRSLTGIDMPDNVHQVDVMRSVSVKLDNDFRADNVILYVEKESGVPIIEINNQKDIKHIAYED